MITPYNSKATKYGLPLTSYATQFNDIVSNEGAATSLTLVSPAGVAIRHVDRKIRVSINDHTGAANKASWRVRIYHAGKCSETTNFNIPEIQPEGGVTNASPDVSLVTTNADPDDDIFIDQEDLAVGYNTVVVETTTYNISFVIVGPGGGGGLSVGDGSLGRATFSYLIYKLFDADLSLVAPPTVSVEEAGPVTIISPPVITIEGSTAVETPQPNEAGSLQPAVLLDPLIKG